MDLFADLNSAQQEAVRAVTGPVLVLAGPGSGKTRVLTHRVGHLIQDLEVEPWRIMAVTFTNKAAREMKERLVKQDILSEAQLNALTAGTFHGICARILRIDIEALGAYRRDFVIFDSSDQLAVVKEILKQENLSSEKNPPQGIHAGISRAKNELLTPKQYRPATYREEIIKRIYEHYEAALEANNALDFDDLIMKTHQLFSQCPQVLERYQEKYLHVMVDEFQDTNLAQYDLVKMLAGQRRNLFVVGDEDQSIYSWRGADYRNVLRFQEDFPKAQTILLERNYRSTQNILQAAGAIINQNRQRHAKTLFTERGQGTPLIRVEAYDGYDEARFVTNEIQWLEESASVNPSEVAVMYRTNAQSRVVEEAFIRAGMPYRLVRGTRFYERKEVKDALAYLRLILNPSDSVSLQRVINTPARGIGPKTVETLFTWAADLGYSSGQALIHLDNLESDNDTAQAAVKQAHPFAGVVTKRLLAFAQILKLLVAAKDQMPLTDLIDLTLARSGYKEFLQDGTEEGEDRWGNLQELKSVARAYDNRPGGESLAMFLEEVALVSDVDGLKDEDRGPALLTLHTAKGLEFPVVFIVGMEDGIFPHSRSREDPEQMEEERRLAYVGVTRAKNQVYLSHAFRRTLYGRDEVSNPSPFLADIPRELVEVRSSQSVGGSRSWEGQLSRRESLYQRQTQWESASERQPSSPPNRHRRPEQAEASTGEDGEFKTGDRVLHQVFGEGTVIQVKQDGRDEIVTIAFPGKGIKQLMVSMAGLEKV
jgi:DNA helicase-2/ATP-dependent DNA helicase PcrA